MNPPTCARKGCDKDAHTRGWCEPHYRHRLHTGRHGYRDATKARGHVHRLRELGWTYAQIAQAAGTSSWVPHKLDTGTVRNLLEESERAILSVPLIQRGSHRSVDGTGTFRRMEALQWMGWPISEISRRVGLKPHTLTTLRSRGEPVSFATARAVSTLYDERSHIPGPSKQTATKARKRGYAPPMAWDDDIIDDPNAQPTTGEPRRRTNVETLDEYAHLQSLGLGDYEIAAKLDLQVSSIPSLRRVLRTRRDQAA